MIRHIRTRQLEEEGDGESGDGRYEFVSGQAKGCRTSEIQIGFEFDVQ
jgi:hypothetical protein